MNFFGLSCPHVCSARSEGACWRYLSAPHAELCAFLVFPPFHMGFDMYILQAPLEAFRLTEHRALKSPICYSSCYITVSLTSSI